MRHVFLVTLFLSIAGNTAQAQPTPTADDGQQSPEVFVVEDDGNGALLIFLGGLKVVRCASVAQHCQALSAKAEIVPAYKGQPSIEGDQADDGAP